MFILEIDKLTTAVDNKIIIKNISLRIPKKSFSVLMGPNASGKTTLIMSIIGNPRYKILSGRIIFDGENITNIPTYERVKKGIFVSYQAPPTIRGVKLGFFLKLLLKRRGLSEAEAERELKNIISFLNIPESFLKRDLNLGFSGGERKRVEIAQLMAMKPKLALLDEIDTGIDIDSMKIIAGAINRILNEGTTVFLITHYKNILSYVIPDRVFVMGNNLIKEYRDIKIAKLIERCGYGCVLEGKCDIEDDQYEQFSPMVY